MYEYIHACMLTKHSNNKLKANKLSWKSSDSNQDVTTYTLHGILGVHVQCVSNCYVVSKELN